MRLSQSHYLSYGFDGLTQVDSSCFFFLSYDGWGKNCNDEWAQLFQQGKAKEDIFSLFCFLFLLLRFLLLHRLRKGGELLLQHIRFLLLGRNVFLLGLLLLKHSEGVYIICGKTGSLSLGRASERIAKNDILLSILFLIH